MAVRKLFDTNGSVTSGKGGKRLRSNRAEKRKEREPDLNELLKSKNIRDKVRGIQLLVNKKLGHLKDKLENVTDAERYNEYVDACIREGICSLDTETEGLNPYLDKIAGVCLGTYNEKSVYVPIHHKSFMTGLPLGGQLDSATVAAGLQRMLNNKVKFVYHNAAFDLHVVKEWLGVSLSCYWDTQVVSMVLNENEDHRLKALWEKYCAPDGYKNDGDLPTFKNLFGNMVFTHVPLDVAYLYAAEDPAKTLDLYDFQYRVLENPKYAKLKFVAMNIELPMVEVLFDMEDRGVDLDYEYAKSLSAKYHAYLETSEKYINVELEKLSGKIESFKKHNPEVGSRLGNPLNLGSSTQVAILLYDILGLTSPDKKNLRGTGADILEHFSKDVPIVKYILEYRTLNKLLSTYVDGIPALINPKTGKIHCTYKQYGAKTGRMSCTNPNLQNIPSRNSKLSDGTVIDAGHDVRQFFTAGEGRVIVGADYSGQEPRSLTHICDEESMRQAYLDNKDLYAFLGSMCFDVPYEECLEFAADGTKNPPEFKARRTQAKSVLLGLLYGRGAASIAEQIHKTKDEALEIMNRFFDAFPKIRKFVDDSQEKARNVGFVETVWGRKRRLPEMRLPEFDVVIKDITKTPLFNPLLDDVEDLNNIEVPDDIWYDYVDRLKACKWPSQRKSIWEEAEANGFKIINNGEKIAEAERKCVNSIVQGTAADMTKLAMIKVFRDPIMQELDAHLLIPVHDKVCRA